jgi:two-component system sensor histidine kinase QseC
MTRRPSIEHALTAGLLVGLFFLSAVAGTVTYGFARRALVKEFDYALAAKARALATLVQQESTGHIEFDFAGEFMPEFEHHKTPEYFQIRLDSGTTLEKSVSLGKRDLPRLGAGIDRPVFHNWTLPDGRTGRVVEIRFIPQIDRDHGGEQGEGQTDALSTTGDAAVVTVARSRASLDKALAALIAALVAGSLLVAAGGAGLVVLTVRWGLRPLRTLADQTAAIGPDTLNNRIEFKSTPRELEPICGRLNDLLARLESAFERERRFTTDVSHELRTPLAEIRTALEVALRWPGDPQLMTESCGEALEASRQAQELVATLLALARNADDNSGIVPEPVNISELAEQACRQLAPKALERNLELRTAIAPSAIVKGSHPLLASCLSNILENAVEYAPAGATVEVNLRRTQEQILITVRNPAPELSTSDVEHMTEPFWRKDAARSDRSHCGLGLAISRSFCKAMKIDLRTELTDSGIIVVRMEAPAANTPEG